MKMSNFTASFYLLLVLLVFTSVKKMVPKVNADCELAVKGGGCPDANKCIEVCRPCYRGIGHITAYCRAAGGGIPFDECICVFKQGAPCNPPSPPRCPGAPPANVTSIKYF